MLRIMIVDDEYYFREALKVSLRWNELGFTICGEAKNGVEALQQLDVIKPDILLVDINMPIMDGLEFVQEIRKAGLGCKIIILTGHSEFLYAKQAVQLGVFDYILKPVDEKELTDTLLKVKKTVERERNIKVEYDTLKRQVKESMPILRDKFLNELIQGSLIWNETGIEKRMDYLNINLNSEYYRVAAIEINRGDNEQWNDEDDLQLWKFAVSNIACEILGECFSFEMCHDDKDRICFIVCINENNHERNLFLENRLEQIISAVLKHLNLSITIGVGNAKNGLYDIAASYKESLVALKNKLTEGMNRIITYCSVEDLEIKVNPFTAWHRNQLLIHMRTSDRKEVFKLIDQIFSEIRKENLHHEILYVICVELISVCMEFIIETRLPVKEIVPNNFLNIIDEIQSKGSVNEIKEWVERIYANVMETACRYRNSRKSKLINDVKKYIQECYMKSGLSIEEISKNLYVNYSHLCFVFKKETGMTIHDYLTEFRMKKAKELFDGGNSLVLDVAEKVGYSDANYFGKCFKKYYGIAPSKYIESKRSII